MRLGCFVTGGNGRIYSGNFGDSVPAWTPVSLDDEIRTLVLAGAFCTTLGYVNKAIR